MNLEPMDVKVELRDSKGRKVKILRTRIHRACGTIYYKLPDDLPAGACVQTVSVKGKPRKAKKGRR